MSKGKFEAPRGGSAASRQTSARGGSSSARPAATRSGSASARPAATRSGGARTGASRSAARRRSGSASLWPILAAVTSIAVLTVCVVLALKLHNRGRSSAADNGTDGSATTEAYQPRGLSRTELESSAQQASDALAHNAMTLTLEPTGPDTLETPIVLTLTPEQSGASLDLDRLRADLNAGTGKIGADDYEVDLGDYLVLRDDTVRTMAEELAETYGTLYSDASSEVVTEKSDSETQKVLVLHKGVTGRSITADRIEAALKSAYLGVARGTSEGSPFRPTLSYLCEVPDQLDLDALWDLYCIAPQDARYDPEKDQIIDDIPGIGFDLEAARTVLAEAEDGAELRIPLTEQRAALTAKKLKKVLFRDTIASFDTVHSWNAPRTNNLILACAALNGTVIQPGEVFSFNKTVGERTEEKGYQAAEAYVSGGASKPELGGGVCQVASTIYCAVLYADLETVERYNHMYAVPYTPQGMDAAIYWGHQDYKFRNTSGYPIRMEASVSGGKVHIKLIGTEWKDYTVEMSCKVWDTYEYESVVEDFPRNSGYREGQIIQTPYTGYDMTTYRTLIYKDGSRSETTKVADSHYNKRNEIIAHLVDSETPPPPATTAPPPPPTTTAPPPPPPTTTAPPTTEPPTTEPEPTPEPTPEPSSDTEPAPEPSSDPEPSSAPEPAPEPSSDEAPAEG